MYFIFFQSIFCFLFYLFLWVSNYKSFIDLSFYRSLFDSIDLKVLIFITTNTYYLWYFFISLQINKKLMLEIKDGK